jgi:hypothetical protein
MPFLIDSNALIDVENGSCFQSDLSDPAKGRNRCIASSGRFRPSRS